MLVSVLYTLIQSNRPQTKSKFQIVSKILRNPGKLTLCWLTKKFDDAKYRIRSRAGQHRKKRKSNCISYICSRKQMGLPTTIIFRNHLGFSHRVIKRTTVRLRQCATTLYMPWLHKKMPFYIYSKTCHLLHSTVRTLCDYEIFFYQFSFRLQALQGALICLLYISFHLIG